MSKIWKWVKLASIFYVYVYGCFMNILGLKIVAHDTGAALISEGRVVAISEERLNRVKYSNDYFPKLSIQYCLDAFHLKPEDIDIILIDQIFSIEDRNMREIFASWEMSSAFTKAKIEIVNHHDAHAASAFFCSPFDEAGVFICDGSGETGINQFGVPEIETETLYYGKGNEMLEIHKTSHARVDGWFPQTWGIGRLYAFFSSKYIGFGGHNEGKMMGLAPYGNDSFLKTIHRNEWFKVYRGGLFVNARINFPKGGGKKEARTFSRIIDAVRWKIKHAAQVCVKVIVEKVYHRQNRFIKESFMFPVINLPRQARNPEIDKLPDEYYASVAYAMQKLLEEVTAWWGTKLKQITRAENIVLAGGVALNIDANKNYLDKVGFKHVWGQPASSDTGIPLGCALYGHHVLLKQPRFWEMKSASLGRSYSESEILNELQKFQDKVAWRKSENIIKEAASFLSQGKIIGWFQGGSEYGPRALGHRSILMDARGKDTRDILNNRVKHREFWRPFAASVLLDNMSEWFELEEPSPFMLLAAQVCQDKKHLIPAVVHVDGTCRIQSVTSESNKKYFDLISEFKNLTGTPLVLNTSFNLAGEPIVESPYDALHTFTRTEMDYLIIEDYIIQKKNT